MNSYLQAGIRFSKLSSCRYGCRQERLELEVILMREGLRFLLLIVFLITFAYKTHISSSPEAQSGEASQIMRLLVVPNRRL